MFVISETDIALIRDAFDRGGEMLAVAELRRLFPGVTDNTEAREFGSLCRHRFPDDGRAGLSILHAHISPLTRSAG